MELLQLFYFDAIARHENITRAADELHISQPSLSGSLLRLERELGYPLFERRARRLFLNPAGRLFWEKARQILQLAAECRLPPDRGPSGQLSVAFQNHNEPFFRLIQAFGRAYPDIRLYIYQSTLHESFSTTSFDFLISTDRHTFPTPMEGRLFARRRWYAVVPAASPSLSAKACRLKICKTSRSVFCRTAGVNRKKPTAFVYGTILSPGVPLPPTVPFINSGFYWKGSCTDSSRRDGWRFFVKNRRCVSSP